MARLCQVIDACIAIFHGQQSFTASTERLRFRRNIISYAVWAYHRFALCLRDVEDLLAERGVVAS
jgi:transposase-like protein